MKIVRINTETGFDQLSNAWSELLIECPRATVNSTFEWVRLWWQHFGGARELFILAAMEGDRLLGVAPLAITTTSAVRGLASRRTIGFLGQGASDYGDFVVPQRHEEVMRAIVAYLVANRRDWDRIELREWPEDSPGISAFVAAVGNAGLGCETSTSSVCLRVNLGDDWDEYYARVRAKFRSDVRRRLGKLTEIGPVRLVRHGRADDALWEDLLQVNAKHLDEKNKQDLGKDIEFLRRLGEVMAPSGMLDISLLKVGSETAAFNIGLRFRKVLYHWRVGFHPDFYKFAPGRLLIRFLLEDCIAEGTDCLDFMRGTEEYKRAWACDERRNINVTVENNQLASRVKTLLRRTLSNDGS